MALLAGEVALALHGAVVLALGLIQNDPHPFPRGKEGVADVGHRAALPLADHLHRGADFDGPAAPVGAHPAAAAAGGLWGGRANQIPDRVKGRHHRVLLSLLKTCQSVLRTNELQP